MMVQLLLTRHGQSQWQVLGDEAGPDSPLTELGRRQADQLGCWLADRVPVNHIYSSPLRRACETAQLVAAHLNLPVHVNDNLKEAPFLAAPKLPAFSMPLDVLDSKGGDHRQGTEDYRMFRSQIAQALRDILGQHNEGTILVVAHVVAIATVIRLLLGSHVFTVHVDNTTLHSLTWKGHRWSVEYIGRRDHLRDL
jgi:broad specificity phosphatase PhoE